MTAAREELGRTQFLVLREALPRVEVVRVEASVTRAEAALRAEATAWTSRLAVLQGDLGDARLAIIRAERARSLVVEGQWVRSPVTGVVGDVRVTRLSAGGVSLEVTLLVEEDE